MFSKKLGRAAAAAGLMALLLPGVATASWWDGGYDGGNDSGYNDGGRRGNDSSSSDREYESPGENPPPEDGGPPAQCEPSDCRRDNPPPQQCGPQGCQRYTPPPQDNPPPQQQCGPQGCERYTPPPQDNPPPQQQCGPQGCERYTPPSDCGQPDCGAPPPSQCGPPDCGAPPPPPCGEPACAQGPPPPPPPPPPPLFEPIYGCENSDLADSYFSLHKTTSPRPGTPVRPGDEILVDITWDVWNCIGPDVHKALDCVYINGVFVPELSGGERPTPNDGHFGFSYFVPLDVPPGSEICDQGFVSGPQGWEEYGRAVSNVVCFPVDVPPPPPPPPPSSCCAPPPPPSCCEAPPVETTTTTAPVEEQPYTETESSRVVQETPPAEALMPAGYEVLPRTGSGPGGGPPGRSRPGAGDTDRSENTPELNAARRALRCP